MKFTHKLLLNSVALNREKAGKDGIGDLGSTLSLSAGVKLDDLDGMIGDKQTVELLEGAYDKEGTLRTNNLAQLSLGIVHEAVKAKLKGGNKTVTFGGGKIDSITLTPKPQRVIDVKFKLKIHPDEEQTGWLGKMYGYELNCALESNQNQIPGDDDEQPGLPLPDKEGAEGKGDKARH